MIVDHINTFLSGGAANAARQLHRSLLEAGIVSRLWYGKAFETPVGEANCQPLETPSTTGRLLARFPQALATAIRKRKLKWQFNRSVPRRAVFSIARRGELTPHHRLALDGNVLHLHWVSLLLDFPSFFRSIPGDLPIVWTLHDMNPLTGGCHVTGGCEGFVTGCGRCPQLQRRGPNDLSRRTFLDKQSALRGKNLHVVTPSRWLEERVRRSLLLSSARSVQTIHNGIDVDVFSPQDKRAARARLGIPIDRLVIGFGADCFGRHYEHKGFPQLLETLSQLEGKSQLVCLAFGNGEVPETLRNALEIRATGYLHDPHQLATVYSAADVFVLPSLEDNLPTTGLEAMACGTPVVAFKTGGIPEFVRPGESGCLAPTGDSAALARQITWMIEHPDERRRMGRSARQVVLRDFHHARQAEKYVQLYRSLLDAGRSPRDVGRAA